MAINPYLNFNGNAKEVMTYYTKVFNLEPPEIMYFSELPPDPNFSVPQDMGHLVMHGSITIDGDKIMFSDTVEAFGSVVTFGDNITIMYNSRDMKGLERLFVLLAEGGKITMPFAETFWSKGYGMLVDQFGVGWQLNFDE